MVDIFDAIARKEQAMKNDARMRVLDWHEVARQIRDNGYTNVSAGLQDDWFWTGGDILIDGEIPDIESGDYPPTYLSSVWATPEVDFGNGRIAAWVYEDDTDGWTATTFWPESARKILKGDA